MKRSFEELTMQQAMELVPNQHILDWVLAPVELAPSSHLLGTLERLNSFDLRHSESKPLLIEALLVEVVPNHPTLKVWKGQTVEGDDVGGPTDYMFARPISYVDSPRLVGARARLDKFHEGTIVAIAQMATIQRANRLDGAESDVLGFVSNGDGWYFLKLTPAAEVFCSGLYVIRDLVQMLGAIDLICRGLVSQG